MVATGLVYGVTITNWWRFYGFMQLYSLSTSLGQGIGVAWSLCIEVLFYAALPIFVVVAARVSGRRFSMRADVLLLVLLSIGSLVLKAHASSTLSFRGSLAPAPTFVYAVADSASLQDLFLWFALGMGLAIASVASETRPASTEAIGRGSRRWPRQGIGALTSSVKARPGLCWVLAAALFAQHYELGLHNDVLGLVASATAAHVLMGLVAVFLLLPGVFSERTQGLVRACSAFVRWPGSASCPTASTSTTSRSSTGSTSTPHRPVSTRSIRSCSSAHSSSRARARPSATTCSSGRSCAVATSGRSDAALRSRLLPGSRSLPWSHRQSRVERGFRLSGSGANRAGDGRQQSDVTATPGGRTAKHRPGNGASVPTLWSRGGGDCRRCGRLRTALSILTPPSTWHRPLHSR